MFATTTGTQVSVRPLCLNVIERSMRTSFRLRSVERFGRMSTSLKSSFVSCADETVGAQRCHRWR